MKLTHTAAALAVLLTGACTQSDDTHLATTPAPTVNLESVAVEQVRDEYPVLTRGIPDSTLIEAMHGTCRFLDEGHDAYDLAVFLETAAEGNIRITGMLAYTSGIGIGTFCPEHMDIFE